MLFSQKIDDVIKMLFSMKKISQLMEKNNVSIPEKWEIDFTENALRFVELTGEMVDSLKD